MNVRPPIQKRRHWSRRGSALVEASIALGAATLLSLLMMKAALLAIGGNDWTTMQTLTDSVITRETALANRAPFADITGAGSMWPDVSSGMPGPVTIQLGKIMGGKAVSGQLTRFRVNQANTADPDVNVAAWKLHSVIQYEVSGTKYVKSSATLRSQ
jgi:hypothetical protein